LEFTVGAIIAGRYRLDRPLGEGGMGAVWAATHTITGGRVALKFVKAAGEDMRKRFLREARAATLVDHPNVVQIRDVLDHEDTPVIVMDLLQGETLGSLLQREGKLSLGHAARIMVPVISAVGAAHEAGLIHRDLKPENVFLARSPRSTETGVVRVLDFGIAKLVRPENDDSATTAMTQSGAVIGTPAYMAPEQLFGERDLDYRVDVWSLGVLLFEMLTGARPVDGDNFGQLAKKLLSQPIPLITEFRSDLPDDIVGIVTRMVARERDDRLRDLREAAEVLGRHTKETAPSFGAPREKLDTGIERSSEQHIVVSSSNSDPNANTMVSPSSGSSKKTTDPNAKTIEAPAAPKMDTAVGLVSATRERPRSWMPVAMGSLAVALVGIVAIRFIPSRSRPRPSSRSRSRRRCQRRSRLRRRLPLQRRPRKPRPRRRFRA
jgi:serine/threonine protein kinase